MTALTDLKAYMGTSLAPSYTDQVLNDVLDTEAADQASRVKTAYKLTAIDNSWDTHPAPLREAILRRCARNLALRKLPLGITDGETQTHIYGKDSEVRRLEAPYLRVSVG